ncbi:monocarboxylate transporter 12 isoform X2 [Cherax quadricarinatus]|uniref:monocarboxylate transporter 12 isoform X2 n=1 Tax=Cherax quadricarinatus TaxID=27406 RepID=UPI00387EE81E
MHSALAMTVHRSKSLPGANGGEWVAEDDSVASRSGGSAGARDSGVVVVASDHPSFASDAHSSLLGDLPSGVIMSELPSEEVPAEKQVPGDEVCKKETIGRHYYPEGGWGWVVLLMALLVHVASHGLHQAAGILILHTMKQFPDESLIAASIGVGMTRDSSTLMVGQYFKRRREFVEIIVVSGSGLGISVMSVFIRGAIESIGWRLGLQAVTGVVFLTFLMGTFYRSASLYHPQRRAILHLKNQKRKVKEKNRQDDKPPFFDVATLKSRTVQILLVSIGLSSFGITTPIIYMAHQAQKEGLGEVSVLLLQTYLGLGWVIGCCAFGFVVLQKNTECRVGRQYLCQASMFLCGVCTLAFTAVEGRLLCL